MKDKDYKVDSTRGMSLLNPQNYKGDVLVQVWIDSRVLATLCNWMDSNGSYSRFMSQVVKRPLEILVNHLVENGEVVMNDDTAKARELLERRFEINLNRGNRGNKNKMHNLTLSDRRGEISERLNVKRVDDIYIPMDDHDSIEELTRKAWARHSHKIKHIPTVEEFRQEQKQDQINKHHIESNIVESSTLHEGMSVTFYLYIYYMMRYPLYKITISSKKIN